MTLSLVPERWEAIGRAEEEGSPVAYIAREKRDFQLRLTVWKLVRREGTWYSVGQWVSQGCWRRFPEKGGIRLSHSRIDRLLEHYANEAIG